MRNAQSMLNWGWLAAARMSACDSVSAVANKQAAVAVFSA